MNKTTALKTAIFIAGLLTLPLAQAAKMSKLRGRHRKARGTRG